MSVVKIWTSQRNVTQTGRAKLSDVVVVPGHLKAPGVFCLWPHTNVVKLVIAEQRTGMTNVTSRLIEDTLASHFSRSELGDLRDALIERCAVRIKRALERGNRHCDARRRHIRSTECFLEKFRIAATSYPFFQSTGYRGRKSQGLRCGDASRNVGPVSSDMGHLRRINRRAEHLTFQRCSILKRDRAA